MKKIVQWIVEFFKAEEGQDSKAPLKTRKRQKLQGHGGEIADYMKKTQLEEPLKSQVIKTDQLRMRLITEMIERIDLRIQELQLRSLGGKETIDVRKAKLELAEYKKMLNKLERRTKTYRLVKDRESTELEVKMEGLRRMIEQEEIDLFFETIIGLATIDDFRNDWIALKARCFQLELQNRQYTITKTDYYQLRIGIYLEILNVIDELYSRNMELNKA